MTKLKACPKLIAYSLIMPAAATSVGAVFILPIAYAGGTLIPVACFLTGFWLVSTTLLCILYRNAFRTIYVDETGISNRYLHIGWAEAAEHTVNEIKIGWAPVWVQEDIICFGSGQKHGIIAQNPRCTVSLVRNEKTKAILRQYAGDDFDFI